MLNLNTEVHVYKHNTSNVRNADDPNDHLGKIDFIGIVKGWGITEGTIWRHNTGYSMNNVYIIELPNHLCYRDQRDNYISEIVVSEDYVRATADTKGV